MPVNKKGGVTPEPKSFWRKVTNRFRYYFTYYVLCRGSLIAYMRRQGMRIGEGCSFLCGVSNLGTEPWLIQIGDRVTLTKGVVLLTHDGSSRLFRDRIPGSSRYGNRFGTVVIHDECFIGVNSIILPDVSIGPNSIVGAGSVVNKDVPPNTVVAGVPAKPICSLEEYIEHYKEKMLSIEAQDRNSLRAELTRKLWGEER